MLRPLRHGRRADVFHAGRSEVLIRVVDREDSGAQQVDLLVDVLRDLVVEIERNAIGRELTP